MGVAEILCSFRLVREGKAGKEIPESSMIRVLRFFANSFALSDAEDNTFGRFNRGAIADLPLLRTLLTFHQKSQEPTFREVMDSVLLTYAIFAASSTLLQKSIACLNITVQKIYSTGTNKKNDFYQLWEQHKQLKAIEMIEFWSDIYNEGYTHQFQPEYTDKIHLQQWSTKFKDILPCNTSQMITKNILNTTRIVLSYAMKRSNPFWLWQKVNGD